MKVTFYVSTGFLGAGRKETIELPDDTTDEGIDSCFEFWLSNNIETTWWKEEED